MFIFKDKKGSKKIFYIPPFKKHRHGKRNGVILSCTFILQKKRFMNIILFRPFLQALFKI